DSKVKVTVQGGPMTKNGQWSGLVKSVQEEVVRLLELAGYEGPVTLSAVNPVKGGSHRKGVHFSHVRPTRTPPTIEFVAQPEGNDTCWDWLLIFPRNCDG